MKRIIDCVLAATALIVSAPAWIATVVLIKLKDPGPALFKQPRVGQNGELFNLYKFRTMFQEPPDENVVAGSVTVRNDPRVFRGGHFLRKFKIDELPQVLNVLEGTMSMVGPRPTVLEDYQRMNEYQRRRFTVKPGITGLAQVSGNTELPWARRIEYDLKYIENQSIWLDFYILFRTFLLVITGKAETHPRGNDEWEDK